jgi:DNA gyrase subunit A
MAPRKPKAKDTTPLEAGDPSLDTIEDNDVINEMENSFLEYSMSVIVARALPDVRDGLKPVHRRILYGMHDERLRPDRPYSKCAKVVGAVMGRMHPHGDSAIYDALVRMAQDFALRLPLVDGHGNFGSPDDPPAASRYTECRLTPGSMAMVEGLDEETVDWSLTYDASEYEPTVLPSGIPNLLVNGSSGIAVGMATNMVPHNLSEVVSGLKALLANPELSLDELMKYIPAPDFPTGGILLGIDGAKDAYSTGKGSLTLRARAEIGEGTAKRKAIIVTELPYNVGTESVVKSIRNMVNAKRIMGVADVKDLSDRKQGLRLVIECKSGFDPAALLTQLYRLTPLQVNIAVQNVALVNNQPRTLTLIELCQYFLDHRLDVITRRTKFRLAKAQAREHLVSGLIKAVNAIDEVVRIIRSSKDTPTAKTALKKTLDLDDIQAQEVLDMPLRRLTGLEVTKLTDEQAALLREIASLTELLGSKEMLAAQVALELDEVADSYGTPRRTTTTELTDDDVKGPSAKDPTAVAAEPCVVVLSYSGLLARTDRGYAVKRPKRHDVVAAYIETSTVSTLIAFTDTGRAIKVPVATLPTMVPPSRGGEAGELIGLDHNEQLVALHSYATDGVYVMITERGVIKRVKYQGLPSKENTEVISLASGDSVVSVVATYGDTTESTELVIVSASARLLRFAASQVRPQGAAAAGMAGMRLAPDDQVVYMGTQPPDQPQVLTTLSDAGRLKVTEASEYPPKGRGTGGVRCQTFRKGENHLVTALLSVEQPVAITKSGSALALDEPLGRRDGSGAAHSAGMIVALGLAPTPPPQSDADQK